MRGPALLGWWIALSLLLVAAPAHAAPLHGAFDLDGPTTLAGDVRWSGPVSAVSLDATPGVPAYRLDASAARIDVHVRTWSSPAATHALFGDRFEEWHDATTSFSAATVTGIQLGEGARLTVTAPEASATVRTTHGQLQAAHEVAASVDPDDQRRHDGGLYPYSVWAEDVFALHAAGIGLQIDGPFTLALWEGSITVTGAEGTETFEAGTSSQRDGPLPVVDRTVQRRVVWATFADAHLAMDWAADALVAGASPHIDVDGTITVPQATGDLVLDTIGIRARGQSMHLAGELRLAPRIDPAAATVPVHLSDPVEPYTGYATAVTGDADDVLVSGARFAPEAPRDTSPAAVGAAGLGLLALAAALYRYGPLAFAVLYSRLEQGALLENPTRSQIYDIVRANPGINARQVHKLSSASWGTVVHHLHKLAEAGYVCTRNHGRATCYYENHGKWDRYQADLAVLSGEKTGRIALAIAAVPGRDQAQIMTRTGLSQSTVSYHLLKLEKAHLVTKERAGQTFVYYPASHLRELIQLLGAQQPPAPTGPGGVPA